MKCTVKRLNQLRRGGGYSAEVKFRWLTLPRITHILYETDDGHHRTLCGQYLRIGEIRHCRVKDVEIRLQCERCLSILFKKEQVVETKETGQQPYVVPIGVRTRERWRRAKRSNFQ